MSVPLNKPALFALLCAAAVETRAADLLPVYEPAAIMTASAIPGLTLRNPPHAASWVLQFGPGKDDTLHLVADCEAALTRHDRLYVYNPKRYPEPHSVRGRWREGAMEYESVSADAIFGKTFFRVEIEPRVTTDWRDEECALQLRMETSLFGEHRASFVLLGKLPAALGSDRQPDSTALFSRPFLKVSWDRRTQPASVKGVLSMGEFRMLPGTGFSSKGSLVILDPDGKTVDSGSFRMQPSDTTGYFLCGAPRRLRPMVAYTARVGMCLSPLAESLEDASSTVLKEE